MTPTPSSPRPSPDFGIGRLFQIALGGRTRPSRWQRTLAAGTWPEVPNAPTGSGKTAGVTLAWIHDRLVRPETTPRRLVWCLPMRTLVDQTELALLHSRFRPADRKREMARVAGPEAESDIIVVATQAVEAGVDISAAVMFTELAPRASMMQRFGRANRRGELPNGARVVL